MVTQEKKQLQLQQHPKSSQSQTAQTTLRSAMMDDHEMMLEISCGCYIVLCGVSKKLRGTDA